MKSSVVSMFTRSAAVGASSRLWMSSRLSAVELLSRGRRELGAAMHTAASRAALRRLELNILSRVGWWCLGKIVDDLRSRARSAEAEEEATD